MDPLDLEAAQKAYEARHLIQQDRGRLAVGHAIAGSVLERSDAQSGALSRVLEAEATAIDHLLVAETDHGSTTVAPPAGLLSCVPCTPHDAAAATAAAATAAAATGNSGPTHNPTTGSIERGQKVGARPAVRASELYAKYHSGDALKHLLSAEEELKSSNASNASTASGSSSGSTESAASAVSVASAVGTTSCASTSGAAAAPAAAAWVFDFSGPKTHLAALGSAAPAVSSTAHKIAPEVRPQTPRTVARLQAARSAAKVLESALSADLSADEAKRGETGASIGASNASSDAAAGRAMALAILGGETLDDILGGHAVEAAVPTAAGSSDQHDGSVLGTARQRAITMRVAAVAKRAQAERAAAAAAAALSAAEAAEAAAAGAEFALMMLMGDDFGDEGALPLVAPPATGG